MRPIVVLPWVVPLWAVLAQVTPAPSFSDDLPSTTTILDGSSPVDPVTTTTATDEEGEPTTTPPPGFAPTTTETTAETTAESTDDAAPSEDPEPSETSTTKESSPEPTTTSDTDVDDPSATNIVIPPEMYDGAEPDEGEIPDVQLSKDEAVEAGAFEVDAYSDRVTDGALTEPEDAEDITHIVVSIPT